MEIYISTICRIIDACTYNCMKTISHNNLEKKYIMHKFLFISKMQKEIKYSSSNRSRQLNKSISDKTCEIKVGPTT